MVPPTFSRDVDRVARIRLRPLGREQLSGGAHDTGTLWICPSNPPPLPSVLGSSVDHNGPTTPHTLQVASPLGTFMPISVFTIGAMDDIWGSVNYAMADPFTCTAPSLSIQSMVEDDWLLLKPIGGVTKNGTIVPLD
jgi:hypothetical protein